MSRSSAFLQSGNERRSMAKLSPCRSAMARYPWFQENPWEKHQERRKGPTVVPNPQKAWRKLISRALKCSDT